MDYDIIIIGGGNAGYSAATTAAQHGAKRVLVLEKGSDETGGGNTFFTAGAFRTVFTGLSDVLTLVTNDDDEVENEVEMAPYTEHDFLEDLYRVTDNRTDKLLAETLVKNSRDAVGWLRDIGVRFTLSFERQAYKVDGKYKFWGGMV
jgi:succinate dehydrogenase/fumarate reductase flavoprotein subunit